MIKDRVSSSPNPSTQAFLVGKESKCEVSGGPEEFHPTPGSFEAIRKFLELEKVCPTIGHNSPRRKREDWREHSKGTSPALRKAPHAPAGFFFCPQLPTNFRVIAQNRDDRLIFEPNEVGENLY